MAVVNNPPSMFGLPSLRKLLLTAVVAATFLSVVLVCQNAFTSNSNLSSVIAQTVIQQTIIRYYFWAMLSPLIVMAAYKWPIMKPHRVRHFWFQLVAYVSVSLLYAAVHSLYALFHGWLQPILSEAFGLKTYVPGNPVQVFRFYAAFSLYLNFFIYIPIAAVTQIYCVTVTLREREAKEAELRTQVALSKLTALQAQIHPHFLFNTLNAISSLITSDPDKAERMVVSLGGLLRESLNGSEVDTATLQRELEFLNLYLSIEKIRFEDRLSVEVNVPPDLLHARVPFMLLQPLAENAIRHGFSKSEGVGLVDISARKEGDRLYLAVADNGTGLDQSTMVALSRRGSGLRITKERLALMYGAEGRFAIHQRAEGGALVEINIPYDSKE